MRRLIVSPDDATVVPLDGTPLAVVLPEDSMSARTLEERVEHLERKVDSLETLPARVTALEVQISEFRAEVRGEFSATRTSIDETRAEMRDLEGRLRQEMHASDDETRAQMRMLHEDMLARFSLLDEHLGRKQPRKRVAKTPRG